MGVVWVFLFVCFVRNEKLDLAAEFTLLIKNLIHYANLGACLPF